MYEFGERKYVVSACLFTGLLCGTVFLATRPNADATYVSENNKYTASVADLLPPSSAASAQQINTKEVEVIEAIPYQKEQRSDPTMVAGHTQLIQAGKDGQKNRVYSITYDDGHETSRSLKSESVTMEPMTEITAIGTSPEIPKTNSDKPPSENSKMPKVELTCKKEDKRSSKNSRPKICLYKS